MPRPRKPRPGQDLEDSSSSAPETPPSSAPVDDAEAVESRPSQLDAIRAARARPPASAQDEAPELPAPEEPPELEAHVDPPPADSEPKPDLATEAPIAAAQGWVPPPTTAPPPAAGAPVMRAGSSLALGIVL